LEEEAAQAITAKLPTTARQSRDPLANTRELSRAQQEAALAIALQDTVENYVRLQITVPNRCS
jgi:hypothetical protein